MKLLLFSALMYFFPKYQEYQLLWSSNHFVCGYPPGAREGQWYVCEGHWYPKR